MPKSTINETSAYFNANWQRYQDSINRDTLFHKEMFSALVKFFAQHYANRPFTLLDIGCGDSQFMAPVLANTSIRKYYGVDQAADVLKLAENNLANIHCEKEFICQDMLNVMSEWRTAVDIIFSSYAIHHLTTAQKNEFIQQCKNNLTEPGFLLMVDGVLAKQQSRDEWLEALRARMKIANPGITKEELDERMVHPCANDFPDSISTFEAIAKNQDWKNFQVLIDKGIFAFMVFTKNI